MDRAQSTTYGRLAAIQCTLSGITPASGSSCDFLPSLPRFRFQRCACAGLTSSGAIDPSGIDPSKVGIYREGEHTDDAGQLAPTVKHIDRIQSIACSRDGADPDNDSVPRPDYVERHGSRRSA